MKTFMCDVCGVSTKQYDLHELYDCYQTKDVKDVCNDCYTQIQVAIYKIDEALKPIKLSWIKGIIKKMKGKL